MVKKTSTLALSISILILFGCQNQEKIDLENQNRQQEVRQVNEIEISTNKGKYKKGENIRIKVIKYTDKTVLYDNTGYQFWWIEYLKDNEWVNPNKQKEQGFQFQSGELGEVCYPIMYERSYPVKIIESQTNAILENKWDQKICSNNDRIIKYIKSGTYRLGFLYGFEVSKNDPFKISNPKVIYSNTFTIENKPFVADNQDKVKCNNSHIKECSKEGESCQLIDRRAGGGDDCEIGLKCDMSDSDGNKGTCIK